MVAGSTAPKATDR